MISIYHLFVSNASPQLLTCASFRSTIALNARATIHKQSSGNLPAIEQSG
jgi:hypothetical protein